jgi:hypothetical protein
MCCWDKRDHLASTSIWKTVTWLDILKYSGLSGIRVAPYTRLLLRRSVDAGLIGLGVSSAITERPDLDEEIYPAEPENDWRGELDYCSIGCAAGRQRY